VTNEPNGGNRRGKSRRRGKKPEAQPAAGSTPGCQADRGRGADRRPACHRGHAALGDRSRLRRPDRMRVELLMARCRSPTSTEEPPRDPTRRTTPPEAAHRPGLIGRVGVRGVLRDPAAPRRPGSWVGLGPGRAGVAAVEDASFVYRDVQVVAGGGECRRGPADLAGGGSGGTTVGGAQHIAAGGDPPPQPVGAFPVEQHHRRAAGQRPGAPAVGGAQHTPRPVASSQRRGVRPTSPAPSGVLGGGDDTIAPAHPPRRVGQHHRRLTTVDGSGDGTAAGAHGEGRRPKDPAARTLRRVAGRGVGGGGVPGCSAFETLFECRQVGWHFLGRLAADDEGDE